MEEMVHVYFFGKQYQVPKALTIMRAMEYAGYQLVRGCGWAVGDRGNYSYTNSVAWGENFVSWTNDDAETQFNLQGSVYSYIALIPTGA